MTWCFNTVFEELRETQSQLKKVSAEYEGEQSLRSLKIISPVPSPEGRREKC